MDTKINLLKRSKREFIDDNKEEKNKFSYSFFEQNDAVSDGDEDEIYEVGLSLLEKEISRQEKKVKLLESCVTMLKPPVVHEVTSTPSLNQL